MPVRATDRDRRICRPVDKRERRSVVVHTGSASVENWDAPPGECPPRLPVASKLRRGVEHLRSDRRQLIQPASPAHGFAQRKRLAQQNARLHNRTCGEAVDRANTSDAHHGNQPGQISQHTSATAISAGRAAAIRK